MVLLALTLCSTVRANRSETRMKSGREMESSLITLGMATRAVMMKMEF